MNSPSGKTSSGPTNVGRANGDDEGNPRPASMSPPDKPSGRASQPETGIPGADHHSYNRRVDLVVIGVSTGGPVALRHVIPKLLPDLAVPVLLVIHMPAAFTARMSEALDKSSPIKVVEARDGLTAGAGTVLVAPGGRHMSVSMARQRTRANRFELQLLDTPHVNGCRPSVDVTLESIAGIASCNTLVVIMTGMGSDGAKGVEMVKEQGGYVLTQTEDTCVIYGMPYAVDRLGLSDERIHLDRIGQRINDLVKNGYPIRTK